MALVILRAIFVMVSVGIAVLIFNSAAMRQAEQWVPWAVLAGMVALPLTVMGIDASIRRKDLTTITAVYFGLLVGVLLTYIAMLALAPVLPLARSHPAWAWMPLILGCVLCYVCTSLLLQTRDDFRFLIPFVEFARDVRGLRPNVLDAAAIVDGRIADLAEAGIFESRFVVPSFVLDELQVAADSADRQRRLRGRRGLDVLSRLRTNKTVEIDVVGPGDEADDDDASAESRVVALARRLGGRIVTNDATVVKLAGVRAVPAINVNDVAVALKPAFVPGDALSVRLVKQGEEPDQGVGYLDDGTMVVVENGRDLIGRTANVHVTSTLQTTAGRLVFARPEAARL
ncbi:MAG: PIN/TRAM domain-containing protein [Planctomycetia bacterium]